MSNSGASERILALDGWRAFAILTVLVGHFMPVPGINMGLFGVELFFVLSGRLMADILFVKKLNLGEFFFRRSTRILPALIVFVLGFFAFGLVMGEPYRMSPVWIATSLTFIQNYVMAFWKVNGWFDHIWSLCVEEHSYMLLGLLAFLLGRGVWRAFYAMLAIALAAMANGVVGDLVLKLEYFSNYSRSDVHLASIFISGAVYLLVRHRLDQALVKRFAAPVFVVALVAGVALNLSAVPMAISYTAGTTLLALAVSLADIAARPIVKFLSMSWLTQIGVWSYSLYLWQQPFYKVVEEHNGSIPLMLAGAAAAGIASFYLVERPARRALNAMWGKWQSRRKAQPEPAT